MIPGVVKVISRFARNVLLGVAEEALPWRKGWWGGRGGGGGGERERE